jgi:hypothetical protein
MQDGIHAGRAHSLAIAALLASIVVAGCGGGSGTQRTAGAGGTARASGGGGAAAGAGGAAPSSVPSAPPNPQAAGLAFAKCMRANGASNFPDPPPGGGFVFNAAGINPDAPAVESAHAKCQRLVPSGPPVPGTRTHPAAATLTKLLHIAECMRSHGVPQFPDPRTSVPREPFGPGGGVITDYDGAILLFPSTLNMESPAYTQATAACGTLARKLGRGPHS